MTRFRIIENVYRKHVTVLFEPDRAKAEKWLGRFMKRDSDLTGSIGRTHYPADGNPGDIIVWLRSRDDITTMVHEFTHVAVWILERCGVPIKYETDEALAYLVEFFMAKTLDNPKQRKFIGSTWK